MGLAAAGRPVKQGHPVFQKRPGLRIADSHGTAEPRSVFPRPPPARSAPRSQADIEHARVRPGRCLADDNGMGSIKDIFFTSGPTEADRPELERLVGVVQRGLAAWAEAGEALKVLRENQLWRLDGARTWEDWCDKRLNIGPRRVLQLEQSAAFGRQLAELLPSKIGSTASAFQLPPSPAPLEPLAGLETAEERVAAYIEASEDAGGVPTREHVKRAVAKRKGKTPIPKARRYRVPGATVRIEFNAKTNGSSIDALMAALKLAELELERSSEAAA